MGQPTHQVRERRVGLGGRDSAHVPEVVDAQVQPPGSGGCALKVPVERVGREVLSRLRGEQQSFAAWVWTSKCCSIADTKCSGIATSRTPARDFGVPTTTLPGIRTTPRRTWIVATTRVDPAREVPEPDRCISGAESVRDSTSIRSVP